MAVVCFQETPPGMCPYFIISGRPQTVNENSDWAKNVVKACEDAAKEIGNTVCLNHSTDGVSCETKWNLEQILGYLSGVTNILSLPDTNHNAKCTRSHIVGGSSVSSIGKYCIDPWLLKQAKGIKKDIVRISDFASDGIVLSLASSSVVEALLQVETKDEGNKLVRAIFP